LHLTTVPGYEVFEARDGKDVLELLANCSALAVLVLLDLDVLVMGAEELAPWTEAATEFQRILDHRGLVFSDPVGALQLGRALVLAERCHAYSGHIARGTKSLTNFDS
jgi:hypothetical protein